MTIDSKETLAVVPSDAYQMKNKRVMKYKPSRRCNNISRDMKVGIFELRYMRGDACYTAADMETAGRK